MQKPSYQQLHDIFVDILNYVEDKPFGGKAREFVEAELKKEGLIEYFGSVLDKKHFSPKLNVPKPSDEIMDKAVLMALTYIEKLDCIGSGGVKKDADKILEAHGCLEYFGSCKDGVLPKFE